MTVLSSASVYPFTRTVNTGSSPEAKHLERRVTEIVHHFRKRAERERSLNELARIVANSGEPEGKISEGARLQPRVSQLACRFLNTLPSAIPAPEIDIDSDGEISFEWLIGRDRQLVVTLSGDGILSYAGVFGAAAKHGREEFEDAVPQELLESIRRLGFAF